MWEINVTARSERAGIFMFSGLVISFCPRHSAEDQRADHWLAPASARTFKAMLSADNAIGHTRTTRLGHERKSMRRFELAG
jgi:hypothetical protein